MIDLHAHLGVPRADEVARHLAGYAEHRAALARRYQDPVTADYMAQVQPVWDQSLTDPVERLRFLDAAGIDTQVISVNPGQYSYWAGPGDSAALTETINAAIRAAVAAGPAGRLLGLGTVSLQHPELAAEQLARAVEHFGLAGVQISTGAGGRDLADAAFEPLWTAAEHHDAVVFLHPLGCPQLTDRLAPAYLNNVVGQPLETTVALSLLIFAGVLDRHPRLRLCVAHGGGYLPHYLGRGEHAWAVRPDSRTMRHPPGDYLRQIWFDTVVHSPAVLTHLIEIVGADRVVIGTDYPFDMGETDPGGLLGAVRDLSPADRDAIRSGNALRLLGPHAGRLVPISQE